MAVDARAFGSADELAAAVTDRWQRPGSIELLDTAAAHAPALQPWWAPARVARDLDWCSIHHSGLDPQRSHNEQIRTLAIGRLEQAGYRDGT